MDQPCELQVGDGAPVEMQDKSVPQLLEMALGDAPLVLSAETAAMVSKTLADADFKEQVTKILPGWQKVRALLKMTAQERAASAAEGEEATPEEEAAAAKAVAADADKLFARGAAAVAEAMCKERGFDSCAVENAAAATTAEAACVDRGFTSCAHEQQEVTGSV
jgi:hypothetical protein